MRLLLLWDHQWHRDYLCNISIVVNMQLVKAVTGMKSEHWTKDEISVAVECWLQVRVELMAW